MATQERRTAQQIGTTAALFVIVWFLGIQPRMGWAAAGEVWWTAVLYVLCCLPALFFLGGHGLRIPVMPIWGIMYFFTFSPSTLSSESFERTFMFVSPEVVMTAIQLTVLGAALLLLAFYGPLGMWAEVRVGQKVSGPPLDPRQMERRGMWFTLLGIAVRYLSGFIHLPVAFAQLITLGIGLGSFGMVCLLLLQLRGQLPILLIFLLWGVAVPTHVMLGLASGLLAEVLAVLMPLLFCYTGERRKIPWPAITVTVLCFIPFAGSVKSQYRQMTWGSEEGPVNAASSPFDKAFAFVELAFTHLVEGGTGTYAEQTESTALRYSQLEAVVYVMEQTPSVIPFWEGETYSDLLWSLVPRFLFPSKPIKQLGQVYGHRYGILDEWDSSTSVNVPHQVIEMYINFGPVGVLVGMALLGCAYRALTSLVARQQVADQALLLGSVVFPGMLDIGSNFTLVFGGVVYFMAFVSLAVRSMEQKGSRGVQTVGLASAGLQ